MLQTSIRAPVFAVLIFMTCALSLRAYLAIKLGEHGLAADFAADLSYLAVPPILALLLWPVLRANKVALLGLLRPQILSIRIAVQAVAIGLLARLAFWCQLVFCIATGITSSNEPTAIAGPQFAFSCPPPAPLLLGLLVWLFLIPTVEEVVHRGLLQSTLMRYGRWTAILASALIFAAFHKPTAMPLALIFGIVFAVQFDRSRVLWPCLFTHATYDGLILLDWRCLRGSWNPPADNLPLAEAAAWSLIGLFATAIAIVYLLATTGVPSAPRSPAC